MFSLYKKKIERANTPISSNLIRLFILQVLYFFRILMNLEISAALELIFSARTKLNLKVKFIINKNIVYPGQNIVVYL